ncbi:MAG: transglutaminase domain-containing protein [Verrucomicrobiota bacterium]
MQGIRAKFLHEIQKKSASRQPVKETSCSQPFLAVNGKPLPWKIETGQIPAGLTIRNPGPETIKNLRISLDAKKISSSIEEIVQTAIAGKSDDKAKALGLWDFIVKNRTHDWPSHSGDEAFDPVKLVSVYGYGFCSHAAKALTILANHAGLETRIRHAKGQHVVCEILIDGRWAMFDPDGEVVYRTKEGWIASVDEIRADPALIHTAQSPIYPQSRLKDIFGNHEFLIIPFEKFGGSPRHKILPELRPGEELVFSKEKRGLFFASRYLEVPKEYANGAWFYEPVIGTEETIPKGLTLTNLSMVGSSQGASLKVSNFNQEAIVQCFFDLPYPSLEAKVEVVFPPGMNSKNSLQVLASRDGKSWATAESSVLKGKAIYQFKDFPNRVGGRPDYKFWVKLVRPANQEGEEFPKFQIGMVLQMAPRSLPIADTNGGNLRLNYETESEQKIEVTFINEISSTGVSLSDEKQGGLVKFEDVSH